MYPAGGRRRRRASTRSGNCIRPRAGKSWCLTAAATRTATRAFGDVSYAYAGQVAQATPIEATAPCGEFLAECNAALGSDLNSCLQNWYEPDHWLGDHRDDERALVPSAPVASVSWGAARRFTLKPRKKMPASLEADAADAVALEPYLGDGDLLVMGGACQQTHVHGVPKRRKKDEGEPGRHHLLDFPSVQGAGHLLARKRRKTGSGPTPAPTSALLRKLGPFWRRPPGGDAARRRWLIGVADG